VKSKSRFRQALSEEVTRLFPLIILIIIVSLLTGLASTRSLILQRIATRMLIDLVLVVGLYIFVGNSGILSFGHTSFLAIGAYASAVLTIPISRRGLILPDLPGFLKGVETSTLETALIVGIIVAALAAVIALPLMRLSGIGASLATLAVLIIVHDVIKNWESVTRGTGTMVGVPLTTTLGNAWIWAIATMTLAYTYQQSSYGLRLRASREDETAARAAGINVVRERRIAFVISAVAVGIGGHLSGHFLATFTPETFFLGITFIAIAMLVVGGMNSLAGAVIGTILVESILEVLRRLEGATDVPGLDLLARPGLRELGLAFLMLLILVLRPRGIMGGREIQRPHPRFRRRERRLLKSGHRS
jgi:branched-chain amino acid transport system permease protein